MTGIFSYANRDLEPVVDTAKLREALAVYEWAEKSTDPDPIPRQWRTVISAARELLTIREAGALIITPDENGKWPHWAVRAHDRAPLGAIETFDALRDAKPDGDT